MTEKGFEKQFLNAIVKDKDDKTRDLARQFYGAVHSGGFRWIGVVEAENVLKRHRLTVYLAEKPDGGLADTVTNPFVELTFRLCPDTFLDLFSLHLEANTLLAELVIEDMAKRFGSANYQPNPRLLFEETIIPPVFYQNP